MRMQILIKIFYQIYRQYNLLAGVGCGRIRAVSYGMNLENKGQSDR